MAKRRIAEVDEAFGADPDELAEQNEQEERDGNYAPAAPVAAPPHQVEPVAPQALAMTVADIQAIVKTAIEASQGGNAAIAEQITQGIAQARKPIPEQTDAANPRISTLNPLGERDHPRPGLKCELFIGTREPKSQTVQRSYGYVAEDLSAYEQIAINTLQPMTGTIKLLDESPIKVDLVGTRDELTNEIKRLVMMVPLGLIQKKSQNKNMLPSICNIVAQLTGRDYSKLSLDDLQWFMAEHRAKRYVTERESVAAA